MVQQRVMISSTSPSSSLSDISKGAMGWLLGALVISYLLAASYTLWINPEISFWKEAYKKKIYSARSITARGEKKTILIGGSSCAFQLDAGLLTQSGITCVNMGMHAGMGTRATAAFGLTAAAPGDTIIWAFERDRMTKPPELELLGYQALVATGVIFKLGPAQMALCNLDYKEAIAAMRPGLDHCALILGKIATGYPLYRYKKSDIRRDGVITTNEKRSFPISSFKQALPDSDTLNWISKMNGELARMDCFTAYLIPQSYVLPQEAEVAKVANSRFLQEVRRLNPVVPDPVMGVQTNLIYFADTSSHLREEYMEKRTKDLAPIISKFLDQQNLSSHQNQRGKHLP